MEKPKHYLYHMVPEGMKTDYEGQHILYPLNILKERFPELYQVNAAKYSGSEYRKAIPGMLIPTLEAAAWGDVIQLSPIHPEDLKEALIEAGFEPREFKFYQIDPALLDPEKTTIFLYREDKEDEDPENFDTYSPEKIAEHAVVPERTKAHYREQRVRNQKPFLFVGVPHIFHKGPIDVSDFPVITV